MSFSSDVKVELCKEVGGRKCCALSECYGILLYCNTFSSKEIKIVTESREFAARLPRLFKKAFGVGFDLLPADDRESTKLTLSITQGDKLFKIFDMYGYDSENLISHHINLGVLEDECCRQSFMRGAFLAGGSVTDPSKRYHLELVTDHYSVSRETVTLLLEMGFTPKQTARGGNYITYFKQSAAIEDFLTTIGSPVSAMEIMSRKIEKGMRNSVNRRVNCDTANVSKVVDAAQQQLEAIRKIESVTGLDSLPDKLRETALIRMEYPEMSLSELAETISPPAYP